MSASIYTQSKHREDRFTSHHEVATCPEDNFFTIPTSPKGKYVEKCKGGVETSSHIDSRRGFSQPAKCALSGGMEPTAPK